MVTTNGRGEKPNNYLEQIENLEKLLNVVDPNNEIYKNSKEQVKELKKRLTTSKENEKEKH